MSSRTLRAEPLPVTIGFAAGPGGRGVAYAAVGSDQNPQRYLRIPFRVPRRPALQDRDVAYAAAAAALDVFFEHGHRTLVIRLQDERLVADLRERRALPAALIMPYVMLGCRLNRFARAHIEAAADPLCRDLTARARAEASLDLAA